MTRRLYDLRMVDGSRHFASLPKSALPSALRDHLAALPGARLSGYASDGVSEAWIDIEYRGQDISVSDHDIEYWFFVDDPECPDAVLHAVLQHAERLLGRHPAG